METYEIALPPKTPGVYALKHVPTQRLYIGSTSSLHRRFQEWRSVIQSGSYWKSDLIKVALANTQPGEWQFLVVSHMDTVDNAREAERLLIIGLVSRNPELCLNTIDTPAEQMPPLASIQAATVIRDGNGRVYTYTEAAVALECRKDTLTKRLSKIRAKYPLPEITIEELRERKVGRPRISPQVARNAVDNIPGAARKNRLADNSVTQ